MPWLPVRIAEPGAAMIRATLIPLSLLPAALLGSVALAQAQTIDTEAGPVTVDPVVADGLRYPWGMAFLPDGRLLVTERGGALRIVGRDGSVSAPLSGTPSVFSQGQGGLLDVALDPDFGSNRLVYLSYAESGDGGASTALGRGRLEGDAIRDFQVIFRQQPKVPGPNHFGGRIVFGPEGMLFLTLGDRFKGEPAQDLSDHLGTVVRIRPDGSVPDDNPFADRPEARDEIWSYGHRNIESAAMHPDTGALWIAEMGPQGGDELNRPEAGRNYGWPVVSWGEHYDGTPIPDPPTHPEFAESLIHWTPVIAPSGMAFYTGEAFPEWQGSILIGGLMAHGIVRVMLDGGEVAGEERIPLGARIRDVEQAPDGTVYVLTDQSEGDVWRLSPAQ
jgi:glucose/arabinose dehydrogenase